jgi:nitrilase
MKQTKVAVVQAQPFLFETDKTIAKMYDLLGGLRAKSPDLVLFPEAFLPGYPRGLTFGAVVGSRSQEGRELFARYYENAVVIGDERFRKLQNMSRELQADMAVGVVEKGEAGGTLYCTILYFGSDGNFLGKHRKLKPTGSERLIWGEGDGSTLPVFNQGFGIYGGLICWENYMPLARMSMYQQGVQIYLAPTADCRDSWQVTLRHIALEGRCFVLGCNQVITLDAYPNDIRTMISDPGTIPCSGGSVIIGPDGDVMEGPLLNEEGILFAELDLEAVVQGKYELDVAGHYNRPDVFSFRVNTGSDGS